MWAMCFFGNYSFAEFEWVVAGCSQTALGTITCQSELEPGLELRTERLEKKSSHCSQTN